MLGVEDGLTQKQTNHGSYRKVVGFVFKEIQYPIIVVFKSFYYRIKLGIIPFLYGSPAKVGGLVF